MKIERNMESFLKSVFIKFLHYGCACRSVAESWLSVYYLITA